MKGWNIHWGMQGWGLYSLIFIPASPLIAVSWYTILKSREINLCLDHRQWYIYIYIYNIFKWINIKEFIFSTAKQCRSCYKIYYVFDSIIRKKRISSSVYKCGLRKEIGHWYRSCNSFFHWFPSKVRAITIKSKILRGDRKSSII